MPPDLPNEQELTLKKRARRRLVGAVALVLLMVIVLPQILQDRAVSAQQEPIKITMPELANVTPESTVKMSVTEMPVNPQPVQQQSASEVSAMVPENKVLSDMNVNEPVVERNAGTDVVNKKSEPPPVAVVDKKIEAKALETTKLETKTPAKQKESFTVQVGVYSDAANVKRLQDQLKQAGFSTHTEKVKTPKGESLRLKAGNFSSRQDASVALAKIKEIGLSGIVIGNE
jgi:DedD protein